MGDIAIRPVTRPDLPQLDRALRALSADLGDRHKAGVDVLEMALFGACPALWALLATRGEQLAGAVLFSPAFSTTKGAAGLYVSDLWVRSDERGSGLGKSLLAAAARRADDLWQAKYLKLAVYDSSPAARQFYRHLGFTPQTTETTLILDAQGLQTLKGHR